MVRQSHEAYGIIDGIVCKVLQPDDSDKLDANTPFFSLEADAIRKTKSGNTVSKATKIKKKVVTDAGAKQAVSDFKTKLENITNKVVAKKV